MYNFTQTKTFNLSTQNILQHCSEISNTKDSFKWQPLYIYFMATRNTKLQNYQFCICGILYFKLNGIDAINEITKPRII